MESRIFKAKEIITMQIVREIYQSSIAPLPLEDKLELAALILDDVTSKKTKENTVSILELIESFPRGRGFKTSAESDEFLR
jgi:hypothetical protein